MTSYDAIYFKKEKSISKLFGFTEPVLDTGKKHIKPPRKHFEGECSSATTPVLSFPVISHLKGKVWFTKKSFENIITQSYISLF